MMTTATAAPATSSNNTNSLNNKYSRYVAGGVTEEANGFLEWWEPFTFSRDPSDRVYTVENFYVGRLDNIASVFYGESRYWWFLAMYNNILDPLTEVVAGRVLLIPTQARLQLMLGAKQGGATSTRQPVTTISPIIT